MNSKIGDYDLGYLAFSALEGVLMNEQAMAGSYISWQ
jgi:hypothetical protein